MQNSSSFWSLINLMLIMLNNDCGSIKIWPLNCVFVKFYCTRTFTPAFSINIACIHTYRDMFINMQLNIAIITEMIFLSQSDKVCDVCWSQWRQFCFWIYFLTLFSSGRRSLWLSLTVSGMSCRSAGRRRTTLLSEGTMSTIIPVSFTVCDAYCSSLHPTLCTALEEEVI